MEALAPFYRNLVDLNGTASRKRGWFIFGVVVVVLALCQLAVQLGLPQAETYAFVFLGPVMAIWIATLVQRLHDAGRSGYWALLVPEPVLGALTVLVILLLPPRTAPCAHPVARKIGALGLMALVLLFISRAFFWQSHRVATDDLAPALLRGDVVIALRVIVSDLSPGDLILTSDPVTGTILPASVVSVASDSIGLRLPPNALVISAKDAHYFRARWVLFSSTGILSDPRLWRPDRFLKGVE